MRSILKKLDRGIRLNNQEYGELMEYMQQLCCRSFPSYELFYAKYAGILFREYSTYLPRFAHSSDDSINYLINNPDILKELQKEYFPFHLFPEQLQPYLNYLYNDQMGYRSLLFFAETIVNKPKIIQELPASRTEKTVLKFEDSNPYKEIGLKAHFDRLALYPFITRLQTYRYLTRNKAVRDKIEVIRGDRLGGIFTNKERSIYYYIFLTENDKDKAANACQLLNLAFYGS